jgi:hypothetical protein
MEVVLPAEERGDEPSGGGGGGPPSRAGGGRTGGEGEHFAGLGGVEGAYVHRKSAERFEFGGAGTAAEEVEFELLGFLGRHFAESVPFSGVRSLCLFVIHYGHFPLQ